MLDSDDPQRPSGGEGRIRRRGAGRPKERERQAGLEKAAEQVLEAHCAGSPTDARVKWTDLKPLALAMGLAH